METKRHEYIVLGAGPAGVQLGYFLEKAGRDYSILERGNHAGSFFDIFPRHRKLISINKRFTGSKDPEFNLRHDWNSLLSDEYAPLFQHYDDRFFPSAENLVRYVNDFASGHGIKISTNVNVQSIAREAGAYVLTDSAGKRHSCRCLVIASGLSQPVTPPIPGIELADCYSKVSLAPEEFRGKRVLVIGKGNSGFETADHIVANAALIHLVSPESIDMAWKTHYVGHLRAVNNTILDTYQLKSQNAVLDADVTGIRRDGDKLVVALHYAHAEDEKEEIAYDRVIYCAGFRFDETIFEASCAPALTNCKKYPAIRWNYASVNQPHMYFAGTITHSLDYKKATSGFVHGFRYNTRALARILAEERHGEPWPARRFAKSAKFLTDAVVERVNQSSALWQQPAYMSDLLAVTDEGVMFYPEMPMGFAREYADDRYDAYFLASLEYGDPIQGDPFRVNRSPDASRSTFLHPVLRLFYKGELVTTHHLLEELEGDWTKPMHVESLAEFFQSGLQSISMKSRAMADEAAMLSLA